MELTQEEEKVLKYADRMTSKSMMYHILFLGIIGVFMLLLGIILKQFPVAIFGFYAISWSGTFIIMVRKKISKLYNIIQKYQDQESQLKGE